MTDTVTLLSAIELVIGGLCLVIAGLAWEYRTKPAGTPLVVLAVGAAGWAAGSGLDSLLVEPGVTRAVQFVVYVLSGVVTVAWFYAVLEHTAREDLWGVPVGPTVAAFVGFDLLSVATDPWHHWYITADSAVGPAGLFDPTPGPLLWLNAAWKTGLVLTGLLLLLREYAVRRGVFSLQTTALAVAGILAPAFTFVELLDLVPVPGFDLGVVGIATSALILLWALFYANLLSVAPIARRTLFEHMDDAVVAVDTAGNVVEMNRRAMELFGVDDAAIGRPAPAVFADRPGLTPAELFGEDAIADDATDDFAARIDGEHRYFELSTTPVFGPASGATPERGERIGLLVVFRDVTLRRRREREIERKNERLAEFAAVVSHDLRNPLGVAEGYLELGRETGDDEFLEEVADAHERMETLIDDLLMLARQGRAVRDPERVELASLCAACWRTVVSDGATLEVTTERAIRADRNRLAQLLENLMRNAIEHGGETVTVTVGDLPDANGFYVADDGSGIPAELRERVLEHGYTSNAAGTGLGLSIVKEIAGAHGWSVNVTESDHGGARFEFADVETVE